MKNILKNNSVIITALCIMIAIVWYLNYTENDKAKLANSDKTQMEQVNDDQDYSANVLTENEATLSDIVNADQTAAEKELGMTDISDEDIDLADGTEVKDEAALSVSDTGEVVTADDKTTTTPGEAVLASTTINSSYFSSAKLAREQNRAREKETLLEIIENPDLSAETIKEATENMMKLNELMEKENATELLLEAKGFEGAVVSILDNSVDVVINAATITEQQIAQIESIVKRKTGVSSENIVISPVVVED